MFVALAGGVGGARLAYGLSRSLPADKLLVAVNTGDDFRHLGLAISPDLDTVCYTLAEYDDLERGWGRAGETWYFMKTMKALGAPDWFALGDADLALNILRTDMLAGGATLSNVTATIAERLGLAVDIAPITDDPVETIILTAEGPLAFQDYFVRQQCQPVATGFDYLGATEAKASEAVRTALARPDLSGLVLCPSNPWLSIGPMLAIPEVGAALRNRSVPSILVSPIVGGRAIKGPAAKLMAELGLEVSALAVAQHYAGLVDAIVVDQKDAALAPQIEDLGLRVLVTDAIMRDRPDRIRLAGELIAWGFA